MSSKDEAKKRDETQPEKADGPPRVSVARLLDGRREAILEHDGQEYRLRVTAAGKLILTK